jgi:hypothetical protein
MKSFGVLIDGMGVSKGVKNEGLRRVWRKEDFSV